MTFRFSKADLPVHARTRREGFAAAVEAVARVEGDQLVIESADWHQLTIDYLPQKPAHVAPPPEPTVVELAANFTSATAKWARAGFPVASAELYAARAAACDACPYWDGAARLGMGKCSSPGCGCTSVKRWYATERCPQGRWPA